MPSASAAAAWVIPWLTRQPCRAHGLGDPVRALRVDINAARRFDGDTVIGSLALIKVRQEGAEVGSVLDVLGDEIRARTPNYR